MSETPQDNQSNNEELRKLRWACRRGMLELDLLFERYIDTQYLQADQAERETFKALLSSEDQSLFDWLIKRQECPKPQFVDLIAKIYSNKMTR